MRLPIVTRAAGLTLSREDCWYGIDQQRRDLERVDAEGLLDDAADFVGQRAGQGARRAGLQDVLLALIRLPAATPARCRRWAPCR